MLAVVGIDGDVNLHAYVKNDPLNRTDPSGRFSVFGVTLPVVVVGAVIIAGCEAAGSCEQLGRLIADVLVDASRMAGQMPIPSIGAPTTFPIAGPLPTTVNQTPGDTNSSADGQSLHAPCGKAAMTLDTDFNSQLRGLTLVMSMHLEYDSERGSYDLALSLAQELELASRSIRMLFKDVGELNVLSFGGGLSQLLLLQVTDEADRGLDRIKYRVRELERNAISFTCADISILA